MADTKKQNSFHWADITADKIIREKGDLPLYTCASGITPSGVVHIGNFREIISVDLVVRALKDRGKNVRFIYSWDDYDVFRKVPANMPRQDELAKFLRHPITAVPDPFEKEESYARHNEVEVEKLLPEVGITPEYIYQSKRYQAAKYAEGMKVALQNRDKIRQILNESRDEAHKMTGEYWPISAFCAKCKKDETEILAYDGEWRVKYRCKSCGFETEVDLRECSEIKLGWRVDWPMRWAYEKNCFEPAGKDHHSQGGSFDTSKKIVAEIYGWQPPVTFQYDFIKIKGTEGKMSSSKGNLVDLGDVLQIYTPEVVRYLFAGTRPNTEFDISFDLDVIKIYEDYDKTERIAYGAQKAKNDEVAAKERRIYELSQVDGMDEKMPYQIPFRHLCNLLQINSGDVDAVCESLPDLATEQKMRFRRRCECAWNWITKFAPEDFRFSLRKPSDEKPVLDAAAQKAIAQIRAEILPVLDDLDEKTLSTRLYDIANAQGIEPKALFCAIYQVLIGKNQGPRLANFFKIVGRERLSSLLGGGGK